MYQNSKYEVSDTIEKLKLRLKASNLGPQLQQTPMKYDSFEPKLTT